MVVRNVITKTQRRLDALKERTYQNAAPNIYGQLYNYVFGYTKEGKRVLWGPIVDAHEADSALASLDDGEVFALPTRDVAKATREIKAILMSRGEDPDEALRRLVHKREE